MNDTINILDAIKLLKNTKKPLYYSVIWTPDDSNYFKAVKKDFIDTLEQAAIHCNTINVLIVEREDGIYVN